MRVMSIIGIVWFSLSLLACVGFMESDLEASAGWGMLGLLYALPYSIVGLVTSLNRAKKTDTGDLDAVAQLHKLFESGALSQEEFAARKAAILNS